ncbi:sterile alpha motif domain-containing protein 14 isoform X2 [Hippocampus comes]|uniref:sterile alpha motif domain-containing protein 14 isoform X2 n=1 Tax=Hippocampus comes TaxID=109280 RepID=UPI00094E34FD|nr:PREDICTED: sterile alpha motif domain-containing protein 14 isoform X2 [Hippocampus comes]
MSAGLDDSDSVFELNSVIPETELLDNSIQKGRAQLSRRHRPSRSRCHDSVSSNDDNGDDSLDRKQDNATFSVHSPLQVTMRGSSPSPDLLLSPRSSPFTFDTSLVRRLPDDAGLSLAVAPRPRYHQLTNDTTQEALATSAGLLSKSCPASSDASPVYTRRSRRPDSEVLVSESSRESSPADPLPVLMDQKTKRRFQDLGVTLRRSYLRVKKDKLDKRDKRASEGGGRDTSDSFQGRECSSSSSRTSTSFVSFSWFSSSGTSPGSPRMHPATEHAPPKSCSQESTLSEDFSPPQTSSSVCPHVELSSSMSSSHPYQTLSQSSDELADEAPSAVASWTSQQVCEWLRELSMDQYVPEFRAGHVDGHSLLQLDGGKLKGLGVLSSCDRGALKRRIKVLQAAADKNKKGKDKDKERRKQREERWN